MSKRPSSAIPVWAQNKHVRAGPSAEDPASEDACVVEKPTLSFEEVKAANADRLKVIGSLSLKTEASVEKIMTEVKAMRPKPGPGFVNEGALVVMTHRGNLYRGTPWVKSRRALVHRTPQPAVHLDHRAHRVPEQKQRFHALRGRGSFGDPAPR